VEYPQEEKVKPLEQFAAGPERAPAILKPSQQERCVDACLSEAIINRKLSWRETNMVSI
jgi:hypothetical protein